MGTNSETRISGKEWPTFQKRKRLKLVIALVIILWAGLLARLYYLQILSHDTLSAAAISQYQVAVDGLDTRGNILDRSLQPLTGGTEAYYYFLQSGREDGGSAELLTAVSARKISAPGTQASKYSVYRTRFFDGTVNRKLKERYGAYVFCSRSRYSDSQIACHLIGYLNDDEKKGVAGLEKACEKVLQAEDSRLTLWADSSGNLLLGVPPKQEGSDTLDAGNLITTIDSGLQKISEEAMRRRNLRGAVLVSHARSGQILAWVSAPSFNPNAVADYLESGEDCLLNKCIQGAYAPGSVFKAVVAAAALEDGAADPEEGFMCRGETEVEGITLGCQSGPEGGHGEVDMYEAMAVSCNCYFAELGEKLGYERILGMAAQFGFGEKVFEQFTEESSGNLPDVLTTGAWDVSNLSIGQGDILSTPAQVHRMMSIIACGGVDVPFSVIMPDGGNNFDGTDTPAKRILSESTARQLSAMLGLVMKEGTGSGDWNYPVYGKTGTAEAVSGGQDVSRCWFSGYCDVGGELFVITVLAENGVSGSASALPVFGEIADYLQMRNFRVE